MFHTRSQPREKDSDAALDFGQALSTSSGTSVPKDSSITLWGPSVKVQETPASILTQSLHVWRKDNSELPAAKAVEELHNMYENLPPEALELTFQDMIGRNNSLKGKPNDKARKLFNKSPGTKLNDASDGGGVKDIEQVNGEPSKEKENSPKVSLFAKIALMLTSKEVYARSERTTLTQDELDRLLERRRRKSTSSTREGLYSASTTPATSFRRVSPITSPKLSPSPSFNDLMLQVDGHSFRSELSNSVSLLESYLDEGGLPPVHEGSQHQGVLPRSPKPATSRTTRGKDANDCSACSTTNLFFLKTNCVVCGKAFCPSCRNLETQEVFSGRRCNNNCGEEQLPVDGRLKKVTTKGRRRACWQIHLGSCMGAPVTKVEY